MDNLKDKLTDQEYREYIVKHMVSPRRCGGLHYYEGKAFYKGELHFVPAETWKNNDEYDKWLETHNHEECEFLWTKLMREHPRKNKEKKE